MEDFVALSSRKRAAWLILGCAIFVVIGLWMVGAFGPIPTGRRYSPAYFQAVGWLSMIFFGLAALPRFPLLFKNHEQLRLSQDGLCWREWSPDLIPWEEISEVSTWQSYGNRAIIIHLKVPNCYSGRGIVALMNVMGRYFAGGDLIISMNSTNWTIDETLEAIERFRMQNCPLLNCRNGQ